jgi:ribosome-binding ATPase YchF (GTP1/OBG family)
MVAVVSPRPDIASPIVRPKGGEGLGNRFVERLRRHIERVLCLVQVMDDDGATLEGHEGNLTYSLFVCL